MHRTLKTVLFNNTCTGGLVHWDSADKGTHRRIDQVVQTGLFIKDSLVKVHPLLTMCSHHPSVLRRVILPLWHSNLFT